LADPNTRQGKRTPVTLKIKFKSETLEQFIERYAVDVSQGGIFIRTKDPLAVGTQMKFEFQLRDASPLIAGEGTVVWTRENDPSRPAIAPGMGVRFDRLGDGSQSVLEKILAEKAKQAPQRGPSEPSKPPLFTDVPTRVAPAPVQDALMGNSGRTRADSEQTPLPKPMPFHSDADEFGAEAFEEATKVRALDELVAATASEDAVPASEDLALRRPSGPVGVPVAVPSNDDRDSAPALPSAPESGNTGRIGKMLDTSPSPRPQTPSSPIPPLRGSQPGIQPSAMPGMPNDRPPEVAKTRLGVEPARAPRPSQRNEAIAATAEPPPERPSAAPIVIGVLVVVAAAIAALWYFVLRAPVAEEVASHNGSANPTLGSAVTPPITNGSAVATNGSAVTGSATTPPIANGVDTQIAANATNATVTIETTGDSGAAPFKAKLEKDKSYKVRVEAPGFVTAELDVKGGQDQAAKLVAKTHVLSITSTPSGAQIMIDSSGIGRVTPYDVELTAAQAAKPKLRVSLRKGGYRQGDVVVDAAAFKEDDKHMTASVDASLTLAPVVPVVHNNNSGSSSTQQGSAATPDSGSASTPVTTPDSGSAAATPTPTPPPPSTSSTGSSTEPTPDFAK
jgi:uncharacterized protein (TIGR02266 family)